MCIDLHLHSIFSDGTATPEELVQMAAERNLGGIALTDHDTVDGIEPFMEAGKRHHVKTIAGIEISAQHRGFSLHILGYGLDPGCDSLRRWLDRVQQGRTERNQNILHKLRELGLHINDRDLDVFSHCGQTGRPHIARLLIKKGAVRTMDQAFNQYLRRGRPAWCARFAYTAEETIAMIHEAGGVAVLAHPGQIDPHVRIQPLLIRELVERGLDGIEVIYPGHGKKIQKELTRLAHRFDLLITGGSDYHGGNRPGSNLAGKNGFCPPYTLLAELERRLFATTTP
ncbi:PHP domain-containing protein [Desulfolithobacter sp.]